MSSLFINFWPIKSFLTYVFKRSFGKFLKNDIDLSLYDFSKKKITLKDLDLNTQIINESLKDSPFKVICCNIGQLRIIQPSLNFLTQKINIEISNVDLILIPTFSNKSEEKNISQQNSANETSYEGNSSSKQEEQKTEEFNILNNLVNKILQNLEVSVSSIAIRVLTKEISEDLNEIPTLLLRVNRIEYKRIKSIDPEKKPVSDTQVIFDGKGLDIGEISLHLMKSTNLYPDEFSSKQPHQQKLKFPFEYPVVNHPNTILLIKPLLPCQQSPSVSQQKPNGSCISAKLEFPQKLKQNNLYVNLVLPNLEVIMSFKQLKELLQFSQDIQTFYNNESSSSEDLLKTVNQSPKQTIDEDILDLYGTMIRTNQPFKDSNLLTNIKLKKTNSVNILPKKDMTQSQITKNRVSQHKIQLRKEKLICSFLQKTQDKKEFQKLKAELKQSVISQSQDDAKLLEQSGIFTSTIENTNESPKLEVTVQAEIQKISIFLICNEGETEYDHVYDSIISLLQPQTEMLGLSNNSFIDFGSLKRFNQSIPNSHYNLEVRNIAIQVHHKQVKIKQSSKPSSLGNYSQSNQLLGKDLTIGSTVKQILFCRYELAQNIISDQQSHDTSSNQYQSAGNLNDTVSNNMMFHSAAEYYQIEEAKTLNQSHTKRNNNRGQGVEQSQLMLHDSQVQGTSKQYYLFDQLQINPKAQHFCQTKVLEIIPLSGQKIYIIASKLVIKQRINQINVDGEIQIGKIQIDIGWNEIVTLLQLQKFLTFNNSLENQKKTIQKKKPKLTQNIKLIFEDIGLNWHYKTSATKFDQYIYNFIYNQKIEYAQQQSSCNCSEQQASPYQSKIHLKIQKPVITIGNNFAILIQSINLAANLDNIVIQLTKATDIEITADSFDHNQSSNQYQNKDHKPMQMYEYERHNSGDSPQSQNIKSDRLNSIDSNTDSFKNMIKLSVQSLHLNINMQQVFQIAKVALDIEQAVKLLILLSDSITIFKDEQKIFETDQKNITQQNQNQILRNRRSQQQIVFQISVCDTQLLLFDEIIKSQETNSSLLTSQALPYITKLRLHNLSFQLKQKKNDENQNLQMKLKIENLFLLDYTQQLITFHSQLLKKSAEYISIQPKKDNHIAKQGTSFYDELQISAPFVLIYKQQDKKQQSQNLNAIDLTAIISIDLKQAKQRQIKIKQLQTLYEEQQVLNKILQLFGEVDQLKKKPMDCQVTFQANSIIGVLSSQFGLLEMVKTYQKDIKVVVKDQRIAPKLKPAQSMDKIHVKLIFQDLIIDYSPALTKESYNKIVNKDSVLTSLKEENTLYKTAMRNVIYIGEGIAQMKIHFDSDKERTLTIKGLQFNMLENNIFTEKYNPILLIDIDNNFDQTGGAGLLDKLGFIQLLTIDILELSNIESIEVKLNEIMQQQDEDEEEDLFETSYGLQTLLTKSNQQKVINQKQMLKLTANKICLYLAKDSFNSVKVLGGVIDKLIDDFNMVRSIRRKQKKKQKKTSKLDFDNELLEEGFQNVLEQFLFMDYNEQDDEITFKTFEDSKQYQSKNPFESQSQINEQDLYYFKVNQINNAQEILTSRDIDLSVLVQTDYIPELNQNLIDQNRYKNCHLLPKDLKHLGQKVDIVIEVHSLDFKLHEGLDFNYDNSQKQINQQMLGEMLDDQENQQKSPSNQDQILFSINEDYLSLEQDSNKGTIVKEVLLLKRPKHSYRGNYFQLCFKNLIYSNIKVQDQQESNCKIDRHCFSIENFLIRESISKKGTYIRELLQLPYNYQYDNQVQLTLQRDIYDAFEEQSIRIKMQPFKLILNQALITFFQEFFNLEFGKQKKIPKRLNQSANQQSNTQSIVQSAEAKPVYIRELKIYALQAVLSYSSESLNFFDLTSGNKVELLNIFNIRDLKVNIKEYNQQQRIKKDQAINLLLEYYKEDLVKNQKVNFVKAIGPLRSFANVAGAFYGVFKKPYAMYSQDKSVVKGIGAGLYGLFKAIGEETSYIASNVSSGKQM